jgi:hypothetical protein
MQPLELERAVQRAPRLRSLPPSFVPILDGFVLRKIEAGPDVAMTLNCEVVMRAAASLKLSKPDVLAEHLRALTTPEIVNPALSLGGFQIIGKRHCEHPDILEPKGLNKVANVQLNRVGSFAICGGEFLGGSVAVIT